MSPIFEQFIRQCLVLPNQPIIVFSDSETPNWSKDSCHSDQTQSHTLTHHDKQLIRAYNSNPKLIPTRLNQINNTIFNGIEPVLNMYNISGAQVFTHGHYAAYQCLGPYVSNWGSGNLAWHPSLKGHEIRADHYAYFWLLIFKDALKEILESSSSSLHQLLQHTTHQLNSKYKYNPYSLKLMYNTVYGDNIQCLTMYKPNYDDDTKLMNMIIPSNKSIDRREPFRKDMIESLMTLILNGLNVKKLNSLKGYLDEKVGLFGNKFSSPLSILINVKKRGYVFICEPSHVRGKLPTGFKRIWNYANKIYLTENVGIENARNTNNNNNNNSVFIFNKNKAKNIAIMCSPYLGGNESCTSAQLNDGGRTLCARTRLEVAEGRHVLTIAPLSFENIMLSTILVP